MQREGPFLIIGLGNPGAAYEKTRHNMGFMVVEKLARHHGMTFKRDDKLSSFVAQGQIRGHRVIVAMPTTYMNLSGKAVRRLVDYYKVPLDSLMIVADDIALDFGRLRLRLKGSSGGQKGLLDIEELLATRDYPRLRVGISHPQGIDLKDYVLSPLTQEEMKLLPELLERAIQTAELWIVEEAEKAINFANTFQAKYLENGEKKNESKPAL